MTIKRTTNGSTYQITEDPTTIRCPDDMIWLKTQLIKNNLKAYIPTISIHDPKNRKPSNELKYWCHKDGLHFSFKLWSTKTNTFVPEFYLSKNEHIRSFYTENTENTV